MYALSSMLLADINYLFLTSAVRVQVVRCCTSRGASCASSLFSPLNVSGDLNDVGHKTFVATIKPTRYK